MLVTPSGSRVMKGSFERLKGLTIRRWIVGALCLPLLLGATVWAGGAVSASAETDTPALTLSPTRQKLEVPPGGSHDGLFQVLNSGEVPMKITVYVKPYQIADIDYSNPDFEGETTRTQASRWVTFEQDSYTLDKDTTLEIPYHLEVPADVAAGGQYAAIFAESTTMTGAAESAVVTKSRVGMLLYVTVAGDTRNAGLITDHKMDLWQPEGPVTAAVTVSNTGNTDFFVDSVFRVKDLFGAESFQFSRQSPVLPDTERRITMDWPDTTMGVYQVSVKTNFLGEENTTEQWVIAVPPGLLIGVVVVLLLVAAMLFFRSLARKKKMAKVVAAAVAEATAAACVAPAVPVVPAEPVALAEPVAPTGSPAPAVPAVPTTPVASTTPVAFAVPAAPAVPTAAVPVDPFAVPPVSAAPPAQTAPVAPVAPTGSPAPAVVPAAPAEPAQVAPPVSAPPAPSAASAPSAPPAPPSVPADGAVESTNEVPRTKGGRHTDG